MNFEIEKNSNKLLFIPLGGVDEIGLNISLYIYKGKILVIDCGIGFANGKTPGALILVPDVSFLQKNKDKICGIIITHAHEDHIGALSYLWNSLGCPIYMTKFASRILQSKFDDFQINIKKSNIIEIEEDSEFKVSHFDIQTVSITHSILEMQSILIKTEIGNVFHTGDWKFDKEPLLGPSTNYKSLKRIARDGILAMVCDSTNIFQKGRSKSEKDLNKSLKKIIEQINKEKPDGAIVVSTFASNIYRIYSLAIAAEQNNRKVVMIGRSLWRMYESAKSCGYLKDSPKIYNEKEIKDFKRGQLLFIATGCQAEENAVMNRISLNKYSYLKTNSSDTIILSSKIIPGNEKNIYAMINRFYRNGAEVITEDTNFVHVSGHASREDLKEMYDIIKPEIAIPIHGESMHLHYHKKFAYDNGVKKSLISKNGDVILLEKGCAKKIGEVNSGYFAIDGYCMVHKNSSIFDIRNKMFNNGSIFVNIIMKGSYVEVLDFYAPGCLDENDDKNLIIDIKNNIIENINGYFFQNKNFNFTNFKVKVTSVIKKYVVSEINKNPYIIVNINIK